MKAVKMRVTDKVSAQDIKKHLNSLGYFCKGYDCFSDGSRYWHYYGEENGDIQYDSSYSDEFFLVGIGYEELFITPEDNVQVVDKADNVNNPAHYTSHPSGIECIDVTRHMSFNLGNATKYIWRCDLKKDAIEDLRKAIFYLNDEIELRLKQKDEF